MDNEQLETNKPQQKTVAKAIIWKFIERIGVNGVSFVISLILARLLMPEDYGILALLNVFIQVSATLIDSGFCSALIQKKDTNQLELCSVFFFSLFFSIICYCFLFIVAPLIAEFYHQDILISVLRVVAVTLIIRVFQCIPFVIVNKQLDFKVSARIAFISNVSSGIIAIVLAYNSFGVWALVMQQILSVIISVILYITNIKWFPNFLFSFSSLKSLFGFGSKMMLLTFSASIFDNIYGVIIGKKYNSTALGIYNRGETFPKLIVSNVSGAMENVIFPTLSYYTDNMNETLRIVRRFIKLSMYFVVPLMFGLIAVAESMVQVLLTDKWLESVFFLRIACVVWILDPLKGASYSTLYAVGKSGVALKFTLLRYLLLLLSLLISVNFGLKGMSIGYAISVTISRFCDLIPMKKLLGYRVCDVLNDIYLSFVMSLVMLIIIIPIAFLNISPLIKLLSQILLGIIVYFVLSILFKSEPFFYVLNNIKKMLNRKI